MDTEWAIGQIDLDTLKPPKQGRPGRGLNSHNDNHGVLKKAYTTTKAAILSRYSNKQQHYQP
jgi:hypothetical protein